VYKLKVDSYEVNVGDKEFLHSSDRDTYPDSGESGGYEWEYLGIPFENAVNAPMVEYGSYIGTGIYGTANPCRLTFSFEPKLVIIIPPNLMSVDGANYDGDITQPMFFTKTHNSFRVRYTSDGISGTGLANYTLDGNVLTWSFAYRPQYDGGICNASGRVYSYIAIG
jgi:hypothetical protein